MPIYYMIFWSIIVVLALGVWRLRSWGQMVGILSVSALILLISQALFNHLALAAGVDPAIVLAHPGDFFRSGPTGWLALLIMPCGWLGPIIGFNLVRRRHQTLPHG